MGQPTPDRDFLRLAGPLLLIETGEVIGVVSSKLAPISPTAQSALEGQQSGFVYTAKAPDGSEIQISEGPVVGRILSALRQQVQLVIGYAVQISSLKSFLTANGVAL
jgi:hypothetical protein